jgi:hypothetical protein
MNLFTPVDTIDTSTFLRSAVQANSSFVEHFLMPVTGFANNGQPVIPKGFDSAYGLFLTIDATGGVNPATGVANSFSSLNVTLWADPKNNDGIPSATETGGATFSNGMTNDIVLATGTLVSASLSLDLTTMTRHADFVESLTPTLEGTVLSGGSIHPGSLLEEKLTTPPSAFQAIPQPDGSTIDLVTGGTAQVTLDPQGTILIPNITPDNLLLSHAPRFIYGKPVESRP